MECAICIEPLDNGDPTHQLECGHEYHFACLLQWAHADQQQRGTCPLCRATESSSQNVDVLPMAWDTCHNATRFRRLSRALTQAAQHFEPHEYRMYSLLVKDMDEKQEQLKAVKRHLADFRRHNKTVLSACRRLESRRWQAEHALCSSRRALLDLFPVVSVVVRREHDNATSITVQPRRSARLLEQAGS